MSKGEYITVPQDRVIGYGPHLIQVELNGLILAVDLPPQLEVKVVEPPATPEVSLAPESPEAEIKRLREQLDICSEAMRGAKRQRDGFHLELLHTRDRLQNALAEVNKSIERGRADAGGPQRINW